MKDISIDYRYIKAFITTAKVLNFSKAAKEMNIAQSAVSRQIKLLEESIGHQLIIRSSKKVILTEKGEELLLQVSKFEEDVQNLLFGNVNKTIRIGILHGLLETWFNDIIVEFSKTHQHQLNVEVNTVQNLKEKLHNGKYDLVISTESFQSDLASSLKLFEEKMVLISKNEINLKNASDYPWIVYSDQDHLFHLYKNRSHKIIVVNSITTIQKLVRKGLGIAIIPDHTIDNESGLKVYELKGLPKQYIHLSSLNFKSMPVHIKDLVELVKRK